MIVTEFKDGDILTYTGNYTTTFIYRNKDNEPNLTTSFYVACNDAPTHNFLIYNKYTLIALNENCDVRLATEDEKIKLFDAIKTNGYKWNAETKTLEKLIAPKFKVGDEIVKKNSISNSYIVNSVSFDYYGLALPDRTGVAVLNVYEQDDWELVLPKHKIKVGDKIAKKDIPTECWYVQGVDTNCNSDYFYYIVAKGKIANLHFKDQDEWELLVITPKFKTGDKIKEKNERFPSTRTINSYVEGIGYYTTIHDWVRIEDQDNWELVPTYKFKVGDKITNGKVTIKIGHIDGDYYYDITRNIANRLFIKFQDEWELVPNKFDISTLKAFDKVLVRDDNNSAWINTFFGFYDTVTNKKYPFIAGSVNWSQCIPYEGNQHLLGTCDDCDEYYKNW